MYIYIQSCNSKGHQIHGLSEKTLFYEGFTSSTLPGYSFSFMVGLTSRVYIQPLVLIPCLNTFKVKLTVFGCVMGFFFPQ